MTAPFSPAAERNKQVILEKLQEVICERKTLLEIGSGTAQHVLHFASVLANVVWQPSNLPEIIQQTQIGLEGHELVNVLEPIALNVSLFDWTSSAYDTVYTANTCHIMSWKDVLAMIEGVSQTLEASGLFCIYGPFNYAGQFTSESNRDFDQSLRTSNKTQGIRNFEDIVKEAKSVKLELLHDFDMPANNRFLIFIKG